ncbi:MAG: hypothetical protein ACO1RT_13005 [Planctomycetaceae bacterium]
MNRDTRRSIGAITGLTIGLTAMWLLDLHGLIAAFIFGAGGAVAGGMIGEKIGK